MRIIGIDPGKHGALAHYANFCGHSYLGTKRFSDYKDDECFIEALVAYFREDAEFDERPIVFLENVHSSPQQGVASAFTFGKGFGIIRGILASFGVRPYLVRPAEWQGALGCLSGGDKKFLCEFAKMKFASVRKTEPITRDTADAALIALYGYHKVINMKGVFDDQRRDITSGIPK